MQQYQKQIRPTTVANYSRYLLTFGICFVLSCVSIIGISTVNSFYSIEPRIHTPQPQLNRIPHIYNKDKITLVTVMCQGTSNDSTSAGTNSSRKGITRQINQLQVMLKSLLGMEYEYLRRIERTANDKNASDNANIGPIELILFTDYKIHFEQVRDFLHNSAEFNPEYLKLINLIYAPAKFPKGHQETNLSRPCTTLRLYIDQLLPNHTEIVYLDTDLIFLKSVRELYNDFYTFNHTQWAGMAMATYNSHSVGRIPYYGFDGLSAGVGLYNLTRMRQSGFSKALGGIFKKYGKKLVYADQDILNIYFNSHPEEVKLLQCHRNFISTFCNNKQNSLCPSISKSGITILHGVNMAFTPQSKEIKFITVFNFFKNLSMTKLQTLDEIREGLQEEFNQNNNVKKKLKTGFCSYLNFRDDLLKY